MKKMTAAQTKGTIIPTNQIKDDRAQKRDERILRLFYIVSELLGNQDPRAVGDVSYGTQITEIQP